VANPNKANAAPVVRQANLAPETIDRMVEQQMAETEVRRLELDLRMQELKHTSAHAEKILGAQERDREAERSHERKKNRYHLLFAGFCVLLLVGLIVAGMHMGKDALISDILKVLGGAIAGALGGYGFSKAEASRKDADE
jgi:cation transport ATPase